MAREAGTTAPFRASFRTFVDRMVRARLFVLIFLTYAYFFQGGDPNQTTRYLLTKAMVERHEVDITPEHYLTIDKGAHEGKFYCDKAPGVSLLATLPYAAMRKLDAVRGVPLDRTTLQARLHTLSLLFSSFATTLVAWLLHRTLRGFGYRERTATLLTVGYALGTIALPFAMVLFGHALAALFVFALFHLAFSFRNAPLTPLRAAALGLLGATSVVVEYPTGILVGIVGLYAIRNHLDHDRNPLRLFALGGCLAAGGILPIATHMIFAKVAYGNAFDLPYKHLIEPFFVPYTSKGLLGIKAPTWTGLYGTFVSRYRGLFFLSPFLALAFVGFREWWGSGRLVRERLTVLSTVFAYLYFNCSYYAWDGGGSTGPRHLVPALAFFVLAIAPFVEASHAKRRLTECLVGVSVFTMLAAAVVLVQMPTASTFLDDPMYRLVYPAIFRGEISINPQDSFLPFARGDSASNAGQLLGLHGLASLVPLALLWSASFVLGRLRPSAADDDRSPIPTRVRTA